MSIKDALTAAQAALVNHAEECTEVNAALALIDKALQEISKPKSSTSYPKPLGYSQHGVPLSYSGH